MKWRTLPQRLKKDSSESFWSPWGLTLPKVEKVALGALFRHLELQELWLNGVAQVLEKSKSCSIK